MKMYKILMTGLISPFKKFKYKMGKKYICKNFNSDKDVECGAGFYATELEGLLYTKLGKGKAVYEAEMGGREVKWDKFKHRFEEQTILRKIPQEELEKLLRKESKKLGYNLKEALLPINPLKIKRPSKVTDKEISLLKQWASVRASVWDSVRDSVWASVRASVWDSVRDSVWDSVRDSVRDSVWAYISSLFPNIEKWKYIKHTEGKNPFKPCIDLWKKGLVPSFDGTTWRLHSGPKAKVVFEITKEELKKRK